MSRAIHWLSAVLLCTGIPVASAQPQPGVIIYPPSENGIEVSNMVAGAVCMDGDEPIRVCGDTAAINITGQHMCDWDVQVRYPCTWFGYQFDYENAEPGQKIVCEVIRSTPTTFGSKTDETSARTAEYTEVLKTADGHLFHPGFNTYAPVKEFIKLRETHICTYAGVKLYRVTYNVLFYPE